VNRGKIPENFRDFIEDVPPEVPIIGSLRLYADNTTGKLKCIDYLGADALPDSLPSVADGLQFVAPEGNDRNSGLSWGSAKLTIMAAYDALPAAGGTVFISSRSTELVAATSTAGQGIWIMGPADPNYANPPSGWRKAKPVSFVGVSGGTSDQQGHIPATPISAGSSATNTQPAIWLSSTSAINFLFANLEIKYPQIAVQLGYDSTGAATDNSGVVGVTFDNLHTSINNNSASTLIGPGWNIGSACFDLYIRDCVIQGNGNVTDGSDNGAAILINSGNLLNTGLIFIKDCVVSGGVIKFYGANASLYVENTYSEDVVAQGGTSVGTVWFASTDQATIGIINGVSTADAVGTVYDVLVAAQYGGDPTVGGTVVVIGSPERQISGPVTLLGARSARFNRVSLNSGEPYSPTDSAIALGSGWGSTGAVSNATGFDSALSFTVTPGGSGISANPVITVTFKDGTWTNPPQVLVQRNDTNSPYGAPPHTISVSATVLTIIFNGTPDSGTPYSFICMALGN
jgi:hypothetical protein